MITINCVCSTWQPCTWYWSKNILLCSLQIITVYVVQAVASVSLKNLNADTSSTCLVLFIRFLQFQLPY